MKTHKPHPKHTSLDKHIIISDFCKAYLSLTLRISRFFGVAPFILKQNGISLIYTIEFSIRYAVYSCLLAVIIPGAVLCGLYSDTYNVDETPEEGNETLNIYVYYLDVSPTAFGMFLGIFGLIWRRNSFLQMVQHLTQMDKILNLKKAKVHSKTTFICLDILGTLVLMAFTFYLWFDNTSMRDTMFAYVYYVTFVMAICFEVVYIQQYFIVNDSVRNRVIALSSCLNVENLPKINKLKYAKKKKTLEAILTISGDKQSQSKMTNRLLDCEYLGQIIRVYEHLQDTLNLIGVIYGPTIVIIMMSIIISFIISTYFAIVDLMQGESIVLLSREVTWSVFFFIQLLMIVEPSHQLGMVIETMRMQICRLLKNAPDGKMKEQIETFSEKMLLAPAPFFWPLRMFHVDRTLLTSVISNILTYLVILVNFHRDRAKKD